MKVESHRKMRFTDRREPLLSNPHKGCATFQRFLQWESGQVVLPTGIDSRAWLPGSKSASLCRTQWGAARRSSVRVSWGPMRKSPKCASP